MLKGKIRENAVFSVRRPNPDWDRYPGHNLQPGLKVYGKPHPRADEKGVSPCFGAVRLDRFHGIPYRLKHEIEVFLREVDKTRAEVESERVPFLPARFLAAGGKG